MLWHEVLRGFERISYDVWALLFCYLGVEGRQLLREICGDLLRTGVSRRRLLFLEKMKLKLIRLALALCAEVSCS